MIIFDNVSKTYGNGVKGLDHINLTIEDGEFVSIIGLSGAGKSTLLRSINRLLQKRGKKNFVRYGGKSGLFPRILIW